MSKKLLFIVPAYPPYFVGGAQVHAKAIVDFLLNKNIQVTVLTTQACSPEDFWQPKRFGRSPVIEENVIRWPIRYLPFHNFVLGTSRFLIYGMAKSHKFVKFASLLGELFPWVPGFAKHAAEMAKGCDAVQIMDMSYDAIWCAGHQAALRAQKPLIVLPLLHLGEPKSKIAIRHLLPHKIKAIFDAQAIIVQTPTEKAFWLSAGVDERRVHLVGVGVNIEEVTGGSAERFRAKLGLQDNAPIVGFLGPFTKDKGVYDLIKAARILWEKGIEFNLILAGNYFGNRKVIGTLANEAHLYITGPLSEEEKKDFLACIDILAMPSRVESFGLVYLEAWSNRKPVIGAYAGGVPDVISDGVDGLVVPFGDPKALSEALLSLLTDRDRAKRLGEAGFEKVTKNYTWDKIFPRLEAVYENVFGSMPRK